MQITDVQVNLCEGSEDRLRAYCAIVIDNEFVVHNIRIIEKSNGLLIAMPSRKLTLKCPSCRMKNPVDAKFCMTCGDACDREEADRQAEAKIHFDIGSEQEGNYVYLTNGTKYEKIYGGDAGCPYFYNFLVDVVERSETAMPQEHPFKVMELAIEAQEMADGEKRNERI